MTTTQKDKTMKMSKERYEELKEGIRQVVDHHGKEKFNEKFKEATLTSKMWYLLTVVNDDSRNTDQHPSYKNGRVRILPYKDYKWSIYEGGLNDEHITTALKKIAKELGLD